MLTTQLNLVVILISKLYLDSPYMLYWSVRKQFHLILIPYFPPLIFIFPNCLFPITVLNTVCLVTSTRTVHGQPPQINATGYNYKVDHSNLANTD